MVLEPIQLTPTIWATKHYVWATMFQLLGAQVASKALKSVCTTYLSLYAAGVVH